MAPVNKVCVGAAKLLFKEEREYTFIHSEAYGIPTALYADNIRWNAEGEEPAPCSAYHQVGSSGSTYTSGSASLVGITAYQEEHAGSDQRPSVMSTVHSR